MKSIFDPATLLPVLFMLILLLTVLLLTITILRRLQVVKLPLAGVEYSQAIFASSILFSVLFIATAEIAPVFQTFFLFPDPHTILQEQSPHEFLASLNFWE